MQFNGVQSSDYVHIKKMRTIMRENKYKQYEQYCLSDSEHIWIPNEFLELKNIMNLYYTYQYDELLEKIPISKINSLRLDIFNLKKVTNDENHLREIDFYISLLNLLHSNLLLYSKNKFMNKELEEQNLILNNLDKLIEYTNEKIAISKKLLINVKFNPKATLGLEPEYHEYIKLYGIPKQGIYRIDLLETIREKMKFEASNIAH
jgi:hypothetical protein